MKISRRSIEFGWQVCAIVLLMGAFVPLWRQMVVGKVDPEVGDPVMRVVLAVAHLSVGLLILQPRRALATARRAPLIWLLIGWIFLSALWSSAPEITLRRAISAVLASLYGVLLATRYPFRTVLRMLGVALAVVVITSIVAAVLIPDWGVMGHPHPGAWQGVLFYKNALGRTSVLALLVFLSLFSDGQNRSRRWWLMLAAAAVITLIGSQSTTALLVALVMSAGWLFLRLMKRLPLLLQPALVLLGMSIALLAVATLPVYLEDLLGLFGKDPTLTGRLPLWELLIPFALRRPFLGYGFGAFWRGWGGPSAQVWAISPWNASHAHNGYLDLSLEVGLVGLGLSLTLLFMLLVRSVRGSPRLKENSVLAFGFLFAAFFAASNASQSMFLRSGLGSSIYWSLFIYVCLLVARSTGQGKVSSVKEPT